MIVILGAGLAGLSTALGLERLAPDLPCRVLERREVAGGLCGSLRGRGFTFDYTGHYLHLRDPGVISWVEDLLGDELVEIERRARIHVRGRMLPFPFQAHLGGLPAELAARCLLDFIDVHAKSSGGDPRRPFDRWAREVFGDGIAEAFMLPYNAKLFGVDPAELTAEWVAWAVPQPDLEQVVRGALGLTNEGMGYNPRFRYPRRGGISALAEALARRAAAKVEYSSAAREIDLERRKVLLEDGREAAFDRLVSTLPLPELLRRVRPAREDLARQLRSAAVLDLQLGVRRTGVAEGAHWIYFPEPEFPFYRVGFPSNVCDTMAPDGHSSLSVEWPLAAGAAPPPRGELLARTRAGLERAGILQPEDELVFDRVVKIDPAYVIFDRRHAAVTAEALDWLANRGVESIGRFGAWTYSYMERALLDGQAAAERVLAGTCAG